MLTPISRHHTARRIEDLEKQRYEFRTENTGRDFIYHLVTVRGVSYHRPEDREQIMRENAERLAFFDNYPTA